MESDFKLYHISKLYYIDNMKQSDIAEIYGTSTMMISRLLKKAEDKGIVKIEVKPFINLDIDLGSKLMKHYPLIRDCLVLKVDSQYDLRKQLGELAAQYVTSVIKDGDIIGLSWGKVMYEFVSAMPEISLPNCQIVQLKGGFLGADSQFLIPTNLVKTMGEKLFCNSLYLNAPIYVSSREIREQMEGDPANSHLFSLAEEASINVFGTSALGAESTISQMNVLSEADIQELSSLNAIGDVDGFFIDKAGNEVVWSKTDCCVGVPLATLSKANHSVCVAGGAEKAGVCRAALQKGYFNVFIVSSDLANEILLKDDESA